eukprot:364944-Chlamydomonas_euryale.AAC.4
MQSRACPDRHHSRNDRMAGLPPLRPPSAWAAAAAADARAQQQARMDVVAAGNMRKVGTGGHTAHPGRRILRCDRNPAGSPSAMGPQHRAGQAARIAAAIGVAKAGTAAAVGEGLAGVSPAWTNPRPGSPGSVWGATQGIGIGAFSPTPADREDSRGGAPVLPGDAADSPPVGVHRRAIHGRTGPPTATCAVALVDDAANTVAPAMVRGRGRGRGGHVAGRGRGRHRHCRCSPRGCDHLQYSRHRDQPRRRAHAASRVHPWRPGRRRQPGGVLLHHPCYAT